MPDEPDSQSFVVWIEQALAKRHREMTEVLIEIDPDSPATVFDLLDGVVAFFGPGLFVNHAMAVGLTERVDDEHLDKLERAAADVGVRSAIETVDAVSLDPLTDRLQQRGYVIDGDTSVVVRPLSDLPPGSNVALDIAQVSDHEVAEWAGISAQGWGHTEPGPRSANDRFADIAHRSGTPGLLIARETATGRGVACADLHIDGDLAVLGGASTIPSKRALGAQSALVLHRLRAAQEAGARVAVATTEPGSQSERNLLRLGFERSHTKRRWTLD